jgi:hypothetical protein
VAHVIISLISSSLRSFSKKLHPVHRSDNEEVRKVRNGDPNAKDSRTRTSLDIELDHPSISEGKDKIGESLVSLSAALTWKG